jgi:hypothetical protein
VTRALAAALACALACGLAAAQEPIGTAIAIEDPTGLVLPRLHAALARTRAGGVARLAFWGASHTASDQYTGLLRERLQRRFGDAGIGLALPALPFALYDRRDLALESGPGWAGRMVRGSSRDPDRYGRAGFAIETRQRTWARIRPRGATRIAHVEAWALAQPGGGTIELAVDSAPVASLATASTSPSLAYAAADVAPGPHAIEVRTDGAGPVRLYGLLAESGAPGVIVESFGVPGARARDQLPWDESALREHVARRVPDLYALAYGTNETGDRTPLAALERDLRDVIARWHRIAPESACLVIGPSDWPLRDGDTYAARPRTNEVRELYRRVAFATGCGFFDLVAFQGGPGSFPRWIAAGMALDSRVHLNDAGHARLAEVLERALLHGLPQH